jgi:hypothetical protein
MIDRDRFQNILERIYEAARRPRPNTRRAEHLEDSW